jgi:hypothetical protein
MQNSIEECFLFSFHNSLNLFVVYKNTGGTPGTAAKDCIIFSKPDDVRFLKSS